MVTIQKYFRLLEEAKNIRDRFETKYKISITDVVDIFKTIPQEPMTKNKFVIVEGKRSGIIFYVFNKKIDHENYTILDYADSLKEAEDKIKNLKSDR